MARRTELYYGPLPHPEALQKYNEIVPGAADRILTQFEQQSAHRRALEERAVKSDIRSRYLGTICGLIIGLAALGVAGFLAYMGKEITGGVIGTAGITGLVWVFVQGTKLKNQDLKNHK